MSMFNFNIDITAPECAMPNLQYETKWWGTMLLPECAGPLLLFFFLYYSGVIFLLVWFVDYFWKRCVQCQKGKSERADSLFGMFFVSNLLSFSIILLQVMFYYLYLQLLRRELDVFNCNPPDPPVIACCILLDFISGWF